MVEITTATPLWEVDHSYQCNEGNYFTNDSSLGPHYKSFAEFLEEWGGPDTDLDYNLVFRWDWDEGDADSRASDFKGDVNYRNGIFKVFHLLQRKGIYTWATVEVCRADEPAVREYLKPRLEHLMRLWSPMI